MIEMELGTSFLFSLAGFMMGSIPFSVLVGRLSLSVDVRGYGDGNPGAINAWKAGGFRLGLAAGVLDFLKGALPVGMANYFFGVGGWGLVAVATLLGSAFSPFLHWRGGKSIAVTFGVWTGLLLFEGPLALGLCLLPFSLLLGSDAWSTMLGFSAFLAYLLFRASGPYLLSIWAANAALLAWKHRADLRGGIALRPFLRHGERGQG